MQEGHRVNATRNDRYARLVSSSVLVALLVAGPILHATRAAAATSTPPCEAHAARTQVLSADSLDNWEPLDDRTVLIWIKHSTRANLVRLARPIDSLVNAPVIYLVDGDHDGSISACGPDGIAIGGGADVGQTVRIISIELLSGRETAELDPGAQPGMTSSFRV